MAVALAAAVVKAVPAVVAAAVGAAAGIAVAVVAAVTVEAAAEGEGMSERRNAGEVESGSEESEKQPEQKGVTSLKSVTETPKEPRRKAHQGLTGKGLFPKVAGQAKGRQEVRENVNQTERRKDVDQIGLDCSRTWCCLNNSMVLIVSESTIYFYLTFFA